MHWTIYPQKATKQLLGTIFFKMASDSKFPTRGTLLKDLMFWGSAQHSLDENQDSFIRCLMLDNKSPSKNIDPDFWNTGEIHKQLLGPASTKKKKKKAVNKRSGSFPQTCEWMQPVQVAWIARNCNHFLQTWHLFGLHHSRHWASHSVPCRRVRECFYGWDAA